MSTTATAPRPRPQLVSFPKEFEKHFLKTFDKRLLMIEAVCIAGIYGIMGYLAFTSTALRESAALQAKIQSKYVEVVLGKKPVVEETTASAAEAKPEETKQEQAQEQRRKQRAARAEAGGKETAELSAEERRAARTAAAEQRAAARAASESQVAGSGVLGLLTAGGGGGEGGGEGVVDVLGGVGAGGIGDLNTALGAGGLTVASSRGQRTVAGRGTGRAAGAGGIDELVSGVAAGQSKSLGRSGAIKIAGPAEIVGQAKGAANRNPDAISEVVNSKQEAVNFCYQQEVRINPDLKGDVAVTFTIKANGKVDNPRIKSSTLNNAKVERCIIDRVRRWEFSPIDPKQGDVTITQKYIFG